MKLSAQAKATQEKQQQQLQSLGKAWDKGQLRLGDHVQPEVLGGRSKRQRKTWSHPNTWSLRGTIEVAFRSIGSTTTAHNRRTHRELDAISVVSVAFERAQQDYVHQFRMALSSRAIDVPWVFIQRSWDETPLKANFGALQAQLSPIAKFWWRDKGKKHAPWVKLDYQEYKRRNLGREVSVGILELMAQSCSVIWAQGPLSADFHSIHRATYLARPCFVENNTAACVFSAFDATEPLLNLDSLANMTRYVRIVCMSLPTDLASTNCRIKVHILDWLQRQNRASLEEGHGLILLWDMWAQCCSHTIHRAVESTFKTQLLIPRLHALAFTCRLPRNRRALIQALERIVAEELDIIRGDPPADCAKYASQVLSATLRRPYFTRARHGFELGADFEGLEELLDELVSVCNGAWWVPRVQHYCAGDCCQRQDPIVTRHRVTAVLAAAWFARLSSCLPACSRWYTFEGALCLNTEGQLCHAILPRAVVRAFANDIPENNIGVGDDGDQESFQMYASRKLKLSLETMQDQPQTLRTFVYALTATEPVDKLSARLQHLDAESGTAGEAVGHRGAVYNAQRAYWEMLHPGDGPSKRYSVEGLLRIHDTEDRAGALADMRMAILSMSAQVWCRFELVFKDWPWRLLLLSDPCEPAETKARVREDFVNSPPCCLDAAFSEGLREVVKAADDLEQPWVSGLLRELRRKLRLTNMSLERQLSLIKASTPTIRGCPSAERVAHLGLLTQAMQHHVHSGKRDARLWSRAELIKEGTPIRAAAKPRPHCARVRRELSWANSQLGNGRAITPQPRLKSAGTSEPCYYEVGIG